jgi:threonine dehydratase
MTATLELQPTTTFTYGDEALAIIDAHRDTVDDHFSVDRLSDEFPRYARWLGHEGVYLAHAEDNLAGAFKWRGAFAGAQQLREQGSERLIVPSAGNHARGAILAAKALDMAVHVIVPTSAPPAKKEQLRELWESPKVSLHTVGRTFDDSLAWAYEHPGYGTLLHPYDNTYVAAGQGTLVDDILAVRSDTQHIVVPVGGGGLLGGVLGRLNELGRNDIRVHAVEAPGSNSLSSSMINGEVTAATQPNQRFGGSAVRYTGMHALHLCIGYSNLELHHVSEETIDIVIDDYQQDRTELLRHSTPNFEPTTLVAVAGLIEITADNPSEVITVVGTGQNDVLRPQHLALRYRVPI